MEIYSNHQILFLLKCHPLAHFILNDFFFSNIYGPHNSVDRQILWSNCTSSTSLMNGPWLIGSDFNITIFHGERNLAECHVTDMQRFDNFINSCNLFNLPLGGRKFMWSNKGEVSSLATLDRFLFSSS